MDAVGVAGLGRGQALQGPQGELAVAPVEARVDRRRPTGQALAFLGVQGLEGARAPGPAHVAGAFGGQIGQRRGVGGGVGPGGGLVDGLGHVPAAQVAQDPPSHPLAQQGGVVVAFGDDLPADPRGDGGDQFGGRGLVQRGHRVRPRRRQEGVAPQRVVAAHLGRVGGGVVAQAVAALADPLAGHVGVWVGDHVVGVVDEPLQAIVPRVAGRFLDRGGGQGGHGPCDRRVAQRPVGDRQRVVGQGGVARAVDVHPRHGAAAQVVVDRREGHHADALLGGDHADRAPRAGELAGQDQLVQRPQRLDQHRLAADVVVGALLAGVAVDPDLPGRVGPFEDGGHVLPRALVQARVAVGGELQIGIFRHAPAHGLALGGGDAESRHDRAVGVEVPSAGPLRPPVAPADAVVGVGAVGAQVVADHRQRLGPDRDEPVLHLQRVLAGQDELAVDGLGGDRLQRVAVDDLSDRRGIGRGQRAGPVDRRGGDFLPVADGLVGVGVGDPGGGAVPSHVHRPVLEAALAVAGVGREARIGQPGLFQRRPGDLGRGQLAGRVEPDFLLPQGDQQVAVALGLIRFVNESDQRLNHVGLRL